MAFIVIQNIIWLAVIAAIALLAKRFGNEIRSPIVKELIGGIVIGNLALVGIHFFEPMKQSGFLAVLSEVAISFFLFRIGFAATVGEMRRIGMRALLVAIVGILATFLLGLIAGPFIVPGLSNLQYVFIATAFTTTSVGITAGILKDLGRLEATGARIVLAAAVIDDIVSLFVLAMVTTQVTSGLPGVIGLNLGILQIAAFIVIGIVVGQFAAHIFPSLFYRLYPHLSAKIVGTLLFFAAFFFGSKLVGLSPIVGSFIGGLVLERGDFNKPDEKLLHGEKVEAFLERASKLLVPVFFVMTGIHMALPSLFSLSTVLIALGFFIVAVLGKLACAWAAGNGNDRMLVGVGMIPRGEVALVFASVGLATAVLTPPLYSAILIVVMATTLLVPVWLTRLTPS